MKRPILAVMAAIALLPALIAGAAARAMPDAGTLSKERHAAVGPLLRSADGGLTPEVRGAYLDWAENTILKELSEAGRTVPEDCLAGVRRNETVRDAMFGSVFPPDPSILQNYAQFRIELGESFLAKYRSLVVAISVAKRTRVSRIRPNSS